MKKKTHRENNVFLSLGSNVPDRVSYLQKALQGIQQISFTKLTKLSSVYDTSSVGVRQKDFLNMVVKISTGLCPVCLLAELKNLEIKIGRIKRGHWQAREIDIDILFYGSKRLSAKTLTIPHPEWRKRKFVLQPLRELAPGFRDPKTGKTVKYYCHQLTDSSQRIRLYKYQ